MTVHNQGVLKILSDKAPQAVLDASEKTPKSILKIWTAAINQGTAESGPFLNALKKMPDDLVFHAIRSCKLDLKKMITVKEGSSYRIENGKKTVIEPPESVQYSWGDYLTFYQAGQNHQKSLAYLLEDKRVSLNGRLIAACAIGRLDRINFLLKEGANPGAWNSLSFVMACSKNNVKVVQRLLEDKRTNPARDDMEELEVACEKGYIEIVRLLLKDKRIDPSKCPQLILDAVDSGKVEIIKTLLDDKRTDISKYGKAALSKAERMGYTDMAKLLRSRIPPLSKL